MFECSNLMPNSSIPLGPNSTCTHGFEHGPRYYFVGIHISLFYFEYYIKENVTIIVHPSRNEGIMVRFELRGQNEKFPQKPMFPMDKGCTFRTKEGLTFVCANPPLDHPLIPLR